MHFLIATIALLLATSQLGAQTVQIVKLPPPTDRSTEEFSSISSVRELKDGRIVVADRRDARIVALNMRSGAVTPIGRKGDGPNEYSSIVPVWPIGGDSSLMIFPGSRWLLLNGASIVATLSPLDPAVAATRGVVRGTNAVGAVFTASALGVGGAYGDSTPLIRINRGSGKVDTITKLKGVAVKRANEPGNPEGPGYFMTSIPALQVTEQTIPFPDGWIAIVRLDPYRVDWRSPAGAWTLGAPLPFTKIAMNDPEKQEYMQRIAARDGKPVQAPATLNGWPATIPPFVSPVSVFAAPDGRAVIGRLSSTKFPNTRYDIVGRNGALASQLELAANEKIVGFGNGTTVYVATTDDNGIQLIARHNWLLVLQQ